MMTDAEKLAELRRWLENQIERFRPKDPLEQFGRVDALNRVMDMGDDAQDDGFDEQGKPDLPWVCDRSEIFRQVREAIIGMDYGRTPS